MAQFHNTPSNCANLASWETGIDYWNPQVGLEYGKRNLISQNWSDIDAKKNRL